MRNIKNKKVFWGSGIGILIVGIILAYIFKPMTMNDIYDKPNFRGVVLEVSNNTILVSVNKEENEIKSSDKLSVSLDTKLKDSMNSFKAHDKVRVFYDGTILETYPGRVNKVYAILLENE